MAWAMFGNMLQKIDAIAATVAAAAHSIYCYKNGGGRGVGNEKDGQKGCSPYLLFETSKI